MRQRVAVAGRFMREVNAAAVLAELRRADRLSVSAIAESTGLSRQAVARSLAVLEEDGLVEISQPDRDTVRAGRPPQMVRFRSEVGYVLGLDVNPHDARAAVADLAGETVGEAHFPLDRAIGASVKHAVRSAVGEALLAAQVPSDRVWHASVGVPGIVDEGRGTVALIPSLPGATGTTVPDAVRSVLSCPVYIDNDVKLATQGERWRGQPRAEESLVFVDWGERIGAGIVLHGQLYRGAHNDAGDLGWLNLLVPDDGSERSELGPFERWVGVSELLRAAADACGTHEPPTFEEFRQAASAGLAWAHDALERIAQRFARGVAALRAVLDPETLIIGGEMAVFGDPLLDAIRRALEHEALTPPRLETSTLGAEAIVQGAIHQSLVTVQRERLALPVAASF